MINFNKKYNKNILFFYKNILYNTTFNKVNHLNTLYYLYLFYANQTEERICYSSCYNKLTVASFVLF